MKKTISGILIICSLLSFQVVNAQSFKTEVGSTQNVNIGAPKFVTDDGCFIFLNKEDNSLFLTVYDKDHRPLYINKKLIFQDQKQIEYAVNIMWMSGYSVINNKELSYGSDMFQKNKSIYFKLYSIKKTYLVEIDYKYGVVVSAEEVEKGSVGSFEYNELKTKYAKLIFNRTTKNDLQLELNVYDINGLMIDHFDIDKSLNMAFYGHSYFLFENEEIFIVSSTVGRSSAEMKVIKCNLKTRKLSYEEIVYDKENGNANIEGVSNNTIDNSLIISWKYWHKKGSGYQRMISRVDKSTLVNTTAKELLNNKMVQLAELDKKYKLTRPELIKVVSDNKGNNTGLFFKHDYSLGEPSAFGLSSFNNKAEELSASIYKFDIRSEDYADFVRNVILLKGNTKNYVFLNNIPDNFNLKLEDKPKKIKTLMGQNPIVIEIDENGNMQQYYVLGTPSAEDVPNYIEFGGSYYDKASNTLIAKMFTESYNGKSKPVWIKLK